MLATTAALLAMIAASVAKAASICAGKLRSLPRRQSSFAQSRLALTERGWAELHPERFQLARQWLRFAVAAAEVFLR